jgi:hypothetical protein
MNILEVTGDDIRTDSSLKAFDSKTTYAIKKLQAKYPHADDLISALLADVEKNELDGDRVDADQDVRQKDNIARIDDLEKQISNLVAKNGLKESK